MSRNGGSILLAICGLLVVLCLLSRTVSVEAAKKDVGSEVEVNDNELENPCLKHKCSSAGHECTIDPDSGEPKCVCIRECPDNTDTRRRVCSNFNQTWQSDCHLLKHRCDCLEGVSHDCTADHKHMHINYYGECKEIGECQAAVLEDFPRRMREWLDAIISQRLSQAERIGKSSSHNDHMAHRWIDAIIWKFCDLDQEPHDRHVSRHELFPLRAPLLSMESCIGTFLDGCDADDDHKITLKEWGKCLGASDEEMEDKCNQFISLKSEAAPLLD